MKKFECIKDLVIVHRYAGGVLRYNIGQTTYEYELIKQGVKPNNEYFKEI